MTTFIPLGFAVDDKDVMLYIQIDRVTSFSTKTFPKYWVEKTTGAFFTAMEELVDQTELDKYEEIENPLFVAKLLLEDGFVAILFGVNAFRFLSLAGQISNGRMADAALRNDPTNHIVILSSE